MSGLPSTLIRHEKGAYRNRFSNWRNLKTPALRYLVDAKQISTEAFQKRWAHDNHEKFSLPSQYPECSMETHPKVVWQLSI